MNRNKEQIDHKAEALRLLEWLGNPIETGGGDDPRSADVLAVAAIHSNFAIADGQERVAEAVEAANEDRREQRASAVEELRELVREVLDGEANSPEDWNPRARRTLAQFDGVDEMGLPRRGPAHLDNRPRRSEAQ